MSPTARRILGFVLGALMGVAYALVSNLINDYVMPGVPVYQPWPGRPMLILIETFAAALMGLMVCWPDEAIPGVIFSALAGGLASSIMMAQQKADDPAVLFRVVALLFYTFLPRVVILSPVCIVLRWVAHLWEQETLYDPFSLRKRLIAPVIMMLLAGVMGIFSMLPQETRYSLSIMTNILNQGLKAESADELPDALKSVDGFFENARGGFTLEVINDPDQIPVQRPFTSFGTIETPVIIRFESGYAFGCVFTPPYPSPFCTWY